MDEWKKYVEEFGANEFIRKVEDKFKIMKITYNMDNFENGKFVVNVGDGVFEEITHIIILDVWKKYIYYSDNKNDRCSSKYFKGFPDNSVVGYKYKKVCKNCPYREEGRKFRCLYNLVLFVKAITKSGKVIDAKMYLKKSNLTAFNQEIENIYVKKDGDKVITLPFFIFLHKIETVKNKKEGVVFYTFKIVDSKLLPEDKVKEIKKEVDELNTIYITNMNSAIEQYYEEQDNESSEDTTKIFDENETEVVSSSGENEDNDFLKSLFE